MKPHAKRRTKKKQQPPAPLPLEGFARERSVLAVLPIAHSTWWDGVRDGRFPKPVRIGRRAVAWRVEEIRALIEKLSQERAHGDRDD